jgi:hypothetical protein
MTAEPLSTHRFSFVGLLSRNQPWVILMCVFASLGLGLTLLCLFRGDLGGLFAGLLFLAGGVACLIPLILGFLRRVTWVEVYPDGLYWQQHGGEGRCAWQDVGSIYRTEKITNGWRQTELKLMLTDGGVVSFNHTLTDYNRLAETVQAATARVLLEPLRQAAAAGEVAFGPVGLGPHGIRMKNELLPWSEVQQHTVHNGHLIVSTERYPGWNGKSIILSEIPNYLVLLRLLAERRHGP